MSSEPLTDHDLGVLRAAGLPLVTHTVVPSPAATELMASIGKAVEEGTPRLVEASALALVTLSTLTEHLPAIDLSPATRRRLGYILARLAKAPLPPADQQRLARWADLLAEDLAPQREPLPLVRDMSPGRFRRLQSAPDATNARWGVFGEVELRSGCAYEPRGG